MNESRVRVCHGAVWAMLSFAGCNALDGPPVAPGETRAPHAEPSPDDAPPVLRPEPPCPPEPPVVPTVSRVEPLEESPVVAEESPVVAVEGWVGGEPLLSDAAPLLTPGADSRDWLLIFDSERDPGAARQGLAAGDDGSIYVASALLAANLETTSGAVLRKLAADGSLLWTRSWHSGNGVFGEAPFAVLALEDGGALVGGQYERADGGCGPGEVAWPDRGCTDAFLTRFDAAGAEVWTLGFGNRAGLDRVMGLARGQDGRVFASGHYNGAVRFGEEVLLESNGGLDHFVIALDADRGEVQWVRTLGGPGDDLDGPSLVSTEDGGVVVLGEGSSSEPFLLRLDAEGRELWSWSEPPLAQEGQAWRGLGDRDGRGDLWIPVALGSALDPTARWTGLLGLDANGQELGRVTIATPAPGLTAILGALPREDGSLVIAARHGEEPLFADTEALTTEVLVLSPDGEVISLGRHARWDFPGRATLGADGALLMAGAFEGASTFGMGIEPIEATGRDLYVQRLGLGD